ncbi:3'-5' exonuclease [Propionivibrio sp.]|uniref:3'-5' exonuclease n=1 Tax=Propionivibrio sp. TaxID=2212460 RepID=UPI002624E889|nr:3'-5' exonuclease [Propionivibrio sp.]
MSWFANLFGMARARRALALAPEQREALANWQQLPAADLSFMHNRGRYVVVDVETSGLNMKKDRLISIGAVALVDGRIDFNDVFQVVLRQDRVSTNENILMHGIGGSAQSEGVEPAAALLSFLGYLGKVPLVAYHAFFDQSMIEKTMLEYLGVELGQTWIDLAWVLPSLFPNPIESRATLDDWLKLFAIENIVRHNAVSDAYATAKLLQVAIAASNQKGVLSPAGFIRMEKDRQLPHKIGSSDGLVCG